MTPKSAAAYHEELSSFRPEERAPRAYRLCGDLDARADAVEAQAQGLRLLAAQMRGEAACLWALVLKGRDISADREREERLRYGLTD